MSSNGAKLRPTRAAAPVVGVTDDVVVPHVPSAFSSAFAAGIAAGLHALAVEASSIPALDGLRTLAIGLVVATHCAGEFAAAGGAANALTRFPLVQGGWSGVDLFFVLSGFLIGRQLVRELKATGSVRVARFVLRRGARIWPLYFLVLTVSLFLHLHAPGFRLRDCLPEAFFLSNYLGEVLVLGSWSLATEEQFYLVAPVAFALLGMVLGERRERIMWLPLVALIAAPLVRAGVWLPLVHAHHADLSNELKELYTPFHTHYDGLAAGLFIACVWKTSSRVRWSGWVVLATGVCAVGLRLLNRPLFNYEGLALVFGALAWHCAQNRQSWASRLFGWKAFRVSSRLSFGIYLWYRLLLPPLVPWTIASTRGLPSTIQFVCVVVVVATVAGGVALASYVLVEKPVLRWRDRFPFFADAP